MPRKHRVVLLITSEDDAELSFIMDEIPANSVEVASIEMVQRDRTYDGIHDIPAEPTYESGDLI